MSEFSSFSPSLAPSSTSIPIPPPMPPPIPLPLPTPILYTFLTFLATGIIQYNKCFNFVRSLASGFQLAFMCIRPDIVLRSSNSEKSTRNCLKRSIIMWTLFRTEAVL